MSERSVLSGDRSRHGLPRHRPDGRTSRQRIHRRRRRVAGLAVLAIVAALAALLTLTAGHTAGPRATIIAPRIAATPRAHHARAVPAPTYGLLAAAASEQVRPRAAFHVTSGMLFDVRTGRVLWQQGAGRRLPIASLTKIMTALEVVAHSRPSEGVTITSAAVHFSGSGVGLLPLGKRVSVVSLLYGLLLPSGNDAAIALADYVAGSERHFVDLMNARAKTMGLRCSHFASASGLVDRDNYSCTTDLAVLAHTLLEQPLLARVVASRSAALPFPIKGGKLYLYNNNPLLLSRYPGADGVKTGFTHASGPCLIATARRGRAWLGVILLHSVDPPGEAAKLLDAGFARVAAQRS